MTTAGLICALLLTFAHTSSSRCSDDLAEHFRIQPLSDLPDHLTLSGLGCTLSLGVACLQVFGPAFRRNSRWSVETPVPGIGDGDTAWELVDKMYDFWFNFRSWREFPHPDEEDVEHAECREERRQASRLCFKKTLFCLRMFMHVILTRICLFCKICSHHLTCRKICFWKIFVGVAILLGFLC